LLPIWISPQRYLKAVQNQNTLGSLGTFFSYKWKAELDIDEGDRLFLGLFESERDAAMCVNQKCAERGIEPLNPSLVEHSKREPESLQWESAVDKWRAGLVDIQKDHDEIMKTLFDCEQDLLQHISMVPDQTIGETSPLSSTSSTSSFGLYVENFHQTLEGEVEGGSDTSLIHDSENVPGKQENQKRSPEMKKLETMPPWYPRQSRLLLGALVIEPSQRRYDNVEYIHCLIAGAENAGKLALVDRYIYDDFMDVNYSNKIHRKISNSGEALETHRAPFIVIDNEAFCPIIHNSSGVTLTQEFLEQTNYVDSIDAFVFVYNIIDRKTFEDLQLLHELIYKARIKRGHVGEIPAILVATCLDRAPKDHAQERFIWDLAFSILRSYFNFTLTTTILSFVGERDTIPWFEGWSLAKRWNLPFLETSSKTGFNIVEAFHATFREAQNPVQQMFGKFTLHRKRSFVNVVTNI